MISERKGEKKMKLIGKLKKQVEETNSKEEAKNIIEKAGMELTDDELNKVTGGEATGGDDGSNTTNGMTKGVCVCGNQGEIDHTCPYCGSQFRKIS